MSRRASGTGDRPTYGAEVGSGSNLVSLSTSAEDVKIGQRITFDATVTNRAGVIILDPDECQKGGLKGYSLDIKAKVVSAPSTARVGVGAGMSLAGSDTATENRCVQFTGNSETVTFGVPPQLEEGVVTIDLTVTGSNSGNQVASDRVQVRVGSGSGGVPPSDEPDDSDDSDDSDDGDNRRDTGSDDGDKKDDDDDKKKKEKKSLSEWWEARSSTEKAAIAIGGAGLLAAVSGQ